jgi:cytochrome c-type biogenesis protein CcmH
VGRLLPLLLCGWCWAGCDRNIEPFREPAPPAAAASPAPGWTVTGTVRLAPGSETAVPAGAVLYLTARAPGERMPLAVERVEAPRFPLPFVLRSGHGMGGSNVVPERLEVGARLSRSGAAGPAAPGDREGRSAEAVPPGATNVEVILDGAR